MMIKIITVLAIVTTGLVAGIFFGFAISVNPAFKHLTDSQYISAMQWINKIIENPVFFFVFFGAVIFTPIAAFMNKNKETSILLFISFAIYLVAVFGITIYMNVPLNNTLAQFSITASTPSEISQMRINYAEPWNYWHQVRTIASVLAFVLSVVACLPLSSSDPINKATSNKRSYHSGVETK